MTEAAILDLRPYLFSIAYRMLGTVGLQRLLADDVSFHGDGGGRAPAVTRPVVGRVQVVRFLQGLLRQGQVIGLRLEPIEVNGQPGARMVDADGRLLSVLSLEIADGKIVALHNQLNPDKLRHLNTSIFWEEHGDR